MSDGSALLEAIRHEPDDDGLRLVYADWLEETGDPERAEFIRVQIESERHVTGSPEHTRLTDRAVELLSKNASEWANGYEPAMPADAVFSVRKAEGGWEVGTNLRKGRKSEGSSRGLFWNMWFRRGFVDEVVSTPEEFFSLDPADIRPAGPLPVLRLQLHNGLSWGTLADFVGPLASAPLLYRFQDLCLNAGFGGTTEEGLYLLANEPALLAKLAGLRVSEDHVGEPAVLRVLESPLVTRLRDLAIDDTGCTQAVVDLLVHSDRFRGMTNLYLNEVIGGGRGFRLFATPGRWPKLRRLMLANGGLDDLTLRGLMRPGAFPALELLELASNHAHYSTVRALLLSGAFPRLQLLGLGGMPLTLADVQLLRDEFGHRVDIGFPVPRRLRPANEETPSGPASPPS
jgi:uncharacterized protein (TIGR02996 family)